MKRYKVLWIDDKAEEQDGFLDLTHLEGINLCPFTTSMRGMIELENKLEEYDAVILDAMVFNESEDERPSPLGLQNSIKKINELSTKRKIPYFIFSAYLDDDPNLSIKQMLSDERIFKKGSENNLLIDAIKSAADQQIETQIKHENKLLFDVLEGYDKEVRKTLIKILIGFENGNSDFEDELYFTQIRIILEHFFRRANEYGLLNDKCVQKNENQVNLSEANLFLSGLDTKHLKIRCKKTHFPKIIAENLRNFLFITGAASHTSNVDITKNIDVQNYRRIIKTPYLLYSLTFQLMDALIWLEEYLKENNNILENQSHYEEIKYDSDGNKYESGIITRISMSGWATVITDYGGVRVDVYHGIVRGLQLKEHQRIKFLIDKKLHAKQVEIIE